MVLGRGVFYNNGLQTRKLKKSCRKRISRSGRELASCGRGWPRRGRTWSAWGGFFNCAALRARLGELGAALNDPAAWADAGRTARLRREQARLERTVTEVADLTARLGEAAELLELTAAELAGAPAWAARKKLEEMLRELAAECGRLERGVAGLNERRMFAGENDGEDCFLTVQAGSGGTEAQDWTAMLFRMYLRHCEARGLAATALEESPGEVAGLKSATIRVAGENAYGWLRTETGVHRLVRKSPFDAGHRRHTSFASVFVFPVVDESVTVALNPAEIRVDTYRASGAGGQHVNKTDSAVRLTHLPTGVVVQCQSDRSQHRNRAEALAMLRARLAQRERDRRDEEKRRLEDAKDDITWGRQIRSYVLDQSRVKDLRTGMESGNPKAVLDGGLDEFIKGNLLAGTGAAGAAGAG